MTENTPGTDRFEDEEPIALAYDDTDGELIAKIYTREAWAELEDAWWIRVEEIEQ